MVDVMVQSPNAGRLDLTRCATQVHPPAPNACSSARQWRNTTASFRQNMPDCGRCGSSSWTNTLPIRCGDWQRLSESPSSRNDRRPSHSWKILRAQLHENAHAGKQHPGCQHPQAAQRVRWLRLRRGVQRPCLLLGCDGLLQDSQHRVHVFNRHLAGCGCCSTHGKAHG